MLVSFIISTIMFIIGCSMVVFHTYCGEQYKKLIREIEHKNNNMFDLDMLAKEDDAFKKKLKFYDIGSSDCAFKVGSSLMILMLLTMLLLGIALWYPEP